jgi:hypothetical protein
MVSEIHFYLLISNNDLVSQSLSTDFSTKEMLKATIALLLFLLNFISYLYNAVKFYKILCYAKLTFEWFPMINPYIWPFSIFRKLTGSYFQLWSKILPPIKIQKSSIDISGVVALEALNALIYFCARIANILVIILQETEKALTLS